MAFGRGTAKQDAMADPKKKPASEKGGKEGVPPSKGGAPVFLVHGDDDYLVTEEAFSARRTSEAIAEAALAGGVRVIQVREKACTARRALEIA